MNLFAGFSYYQILELSRAASQEEIAAAYRRMLVIYGPDGLAAYSLFTPEERVEILAQIEESHQVLSDEARRKEYDALLRAQPPAPVATGPQPALPFEEGSPAPAGPPSSSPPAEPPISEPETRPAEPPLEISGESLRRYRETLGLNLETIWERTRIRKGLLQAIEDEDRKLLPAPVFLKGLLLAYARALNLTAPEVVAQQYLDHLQSHAG